MEGLGINMSSTEHTRDDDAENSPTPTSTLAVDASPELGDEQQQHVLHGNGGQGDHSGDGERADEEGGEAEEDEEPKLKYTRLTSSLGNVYRNGDATSAALVAGDKLVLGTHNGNIVFLPFVPIDMLN